ncbi:hypothetical protein [Marinicauda pacifica]|uniref:hypothetical protein n=1 Tax=Marinicauda pacifica TaxID=1133559 RepID=UPI0035C7F75D
MLASFSQRDERVRPGRIERVQDVTIVGMDSAQASETPGDQGKGCGRHAPGKGWY